MHDTIKRFGMSGSADSERFLSVRESFIKEIEDSMRDEGYVPVLDLNPQVTREYNNSTNCFDIKVTVYGVHIGERAWDVTGVTNGVVVERSTHQSK